MRFLLKVSIPVEAGNKAAREDRLGETIEAILAEQKSEAVYFLAERGKGRLSSSSTCRMLHKSLR